MSSTSEENSDQKRQSVSSLKDLMHNQQKEKHEVSGESQENKRNTMPSFLHNHDKLSKDLEGTTTSADLQNSKSSTIDEEIDSLLNEIGAKNTTALDQTQFLTHSINKPLQGQQSTIFSKANTQTDAAAIKQPDNQANPIFHPIYKTYGQNHEQSLAHIKQALYITPLEASQIKSSADASLYLGEIYSRRGTKNIFTIADNKTEIGHLVAIDEKRLQLHFNPSFTGALAWPLVNREGNPVNAADKYYVFEGKIIKQELAEPASANLPKNHKNSKEVELQILRNLTAICNNEMNNSALLPSQRMARLEILAPYITEALSLKDSTLATEQQHLLEATQSIMKKTGLALTTGYNLPEPSKRTNEDTKNVVEENLADPSKISIKHIPAQKHTVGITEMTPPSSPPQFITQYPQHHSKHAHKLNEEDLAIYRTSENLQALEKVVEAAIIQSSPMHTQEAQNSLINGNMDATDQAQTAQIATIETFTLGHASDVQAFSDNESQAVRHTHAPLMNNALPATLTEPKTITEPTHLQLNLPEIIKNEWAKGNRAMLPAIDDGGRYKPVTKSGSLTRSKFWERILGKSSMHLYHAGNRVATISNTPDATSQLELRENFTGSLLLPVTSGRNLEDKLTGNLVLDCYNGLVIGYDVKRFHTGNPQNLYEKIQGGQAALNQAVCTNLLFAMQTADDTQDQERLAKAKENAKHYLSPSQNEELAHAWNAYKTNADSASTASSHLTTESMDASSFLSDKTAVSSAQSSSMYTPSINDQAEKDSLPTIHTEESTAPTHLELTLNSAQKKAWSKGQQGYLPRIIDEYGSHASVSVSGSLTHSNAETGDQHTTPSIATTLSFSHDGTARINSVALQLPQPDKATIPASGVAATSDAEQGAASKLAATMSKHRAEHVEKTQSTPPAVSIPSINQQQPMPVQSSIQSSQPAVSSSGVVPSPARASHTSQSDVQPTAPRRPKQLEDEEERRMRLGDVDGIITLIGWLFQMIFDIIGAIATGISQGLSHSKATPVGTRRRKISWEEAKDTSPVSSHTSAEALADNLKRQSVINTTHFPSSEGGNPPYTPQSTPQPPQRPTREQG